MSLTFPNCLSVHSFSKSIYHITMKIVHLRCCMLKIHESDWTMKMDSYYSFWVLLSILSGGWGSRGYRITLLS